MAQRISGYARKDDESYPTVEASPVRVLLPYLCGIGVTWDPADFR